MPFDVYIQAVPKMPKQGDDYEYVCSLDNNGYYWFLYPLFEELSAETGQLIDLYDGAIFGKHHLDALLLVLDSAKRLTNSQPDQWQVATSVQIKPQQKIIYADVEKVEMLCLIDKLSDGAEIARSTDRFLLFFGD